MTTDNKRRLQETRQSWDQAAPTFDDQPDHGLRDPHVRQAWSDHLTNWLPPPPASILDVGCGTGSLSVVLAALGYEVTGLDLSPAMVAHAEAKVRAAGQRVTFWVMDAAFPQLEGQRFDAIVCRHLLWTLPEPAQVLRRWAALLAPGGRFVLIEGCWQTGAGLRSQAVIDALPASFTRVLLQPLSDEPALWGGPVTDERYTVIARFPVDASTRW